MAFVIEKLNLINIVEVISKGASTKPLLVNAENSKGEINSFVVKLYKREYVQQHLVVFKEILVSELSREFNLPLPDYGIINFEHELLEPYYQRDFIDSLDEGFKFCTQYMDGGVIYNPWINDKFFDAYDLENIFAFDNLIVNPDRGGLRNKPNLLIRNHEFLLIDHEQSFPFITASGGEEIDAGQRFKQFYYKAHLFYPALQKKKDKSSLFNEFGEYIRTLGLKFINPLFKELEEYDINCPQKYTIFAYLNWFKNNPDQVIKVLRDRTL